MKKEEATFNNSDENIQKELTPYLHKTDAFERLILQKPYKKDDIEKVINKSKGKKSGYEPISQNTTTIQNEGDYGKV